MQYEAEAGKITIALVGDAMINRRMAGHREPGYLEMLDVVRLRRLQRGEPRDADQRVRALVGPEARLDLVAGRRPGVPGRPPVDGIRCGHGREQPLVRLQRGRVPDDAPSRPRARARLRRRGHEPGRGRAGRAIADLAQGRVALMAACSTFSDQSEAGAARPDFPGKPGINALHHDVVHTVPESVSITLREAKRGLGYEEYEDVHHRFHPHRAEHYDHESEVRFLGGRSAVPTATRSRRAAARPISRGSSAGSAAQPQHRLADLQPSHARERADRGDPRGVPREPAGLPRRVRPPGDRRGLPARDRPRPALPARHRDVPGPADLLQPRELHLPQRHRQAAARAGLCPPRAGGRAHSGRLGCGAVGRGCVRLPGRPGVLPERDRRLRVRRRRAPTR